MDNTGLEENKESYNKNEEKKEIKESQNNLKKIRYNCFEEEQKEYKKELKKINNKENVYKNNIKNKSNNLRDMKNCNKNLYKKEVSYIIDQFFLRNNGII